MKKVYFDKLIALTIDEKNNVIINGMQLIHDGEKLYEQGEITVEEAKAITDKRKKGKDGQYSDEDMKAIRDEVESTEKKNKKEITLYI
jgi:hypothetical protein